MTDAGCRIKTAEAIAATIDAAEEVFDQVTEQGSGKPRLFVDKSNPDETVAALRDILAQAGRLYDRGVPVRLAFDQVQKGMVAQVMTSYGMVLEAHTSLGVEEGGCS